MKSLQVQPFLLNAHTLSNACLNMKQKQVQTRALRPQPSHQSSSFQQTKREEASVSALLHTPKMKV